VQTPQLQHDQEQEEDDRAPRDEQVLPVLPEAHGAQRDEVKREFGSLVVWLSGYFVSPNNQITK
jgi:hypothetical protein